VQQIQKRVSHPFPRLKCLNTPCWASHTFDTVWAWYNFL
jgi:hypothetical protein